MEADTVIRRTDRDAAHARFARPIEGMPAA